MNNFERLKAHILSLSDSVIYSYAVSEWKLDYIELLEDDEEENCPCGKHGIREICYLINTINGNQTFVGNVCVNKFIGIQAKKIFSGAKALKKDIALRIKPDLIIYCYDRGIINDFEIEFIKNVNSRRSLSQKQMSLLLKLKEKIIHSTHRVIT